MNRKQTLAAIKAAGMAATYSPDWGEYRVTYTAADMPDKERREAVASYTDDAQDALDTAKAMRAHLDAQRRADTKAALIHGTAPKPRAPLNMRSRTN